jgi:hypothetical protein
MFLSTIIVATDTLFLRQTNLQRSSPDATPSKCQLSVPPLKPRFQARSEQFGVAGS